MRTDRTRRGSGAVLLVVLWWTVQVGWAPTADADEVTPVFTTESWCAGYVETQSTVPRDLLPIALPITLPVLPGDLLGHSESAGPDCPASAEADHQRARAEGVASPDGWWALATGATSTDDGLALASTMLMLRTDVDLDDAGDLLVHFDDVRGTFAEACCQGIVDAGYGVGIRVSSEAGEFDVWCGTGSFRGPETSYTLPDDRCGLQGGNPARLPVSAGAVHVEITIQAQSVVSGADFDATRASARISRLTTAPAPSAASATSSTTAPGTGAPSAAAVSSAEEGAPAVAGLAVRRATELARSGSTSSGLVDVGAALVAAGVVLGVVARHRATTAARRSAINALLSQW